jgi:DNA-binding response OmpR family regulator
VLFVEDSLDVRLTFLGILAGEGFDAYDAPDGREGLDRARALRPDVIVMDLSLPLMDGMEALRHLKADERTRNIPVIALTGRIVPVWQLTKAGFDAVLTKPCMPGVLVARVRALSDRARAGSRTPSERKSG